ncbi:MAG TPA: M20/M25/M40 family metallo-hydrolase [Candidatus Dormibacteraeota bacterium]|nr:M20/M25/M40 family metallo-hydrolase [Candidatus Dormibacteraeota bacterium]
MLDQVLERARGARAAAEAELFELISIPSVSALPEHRDDCRRAAAWLERRLRAMGMEASLIDVPGGGHPVVEAEWLGRPGAPTLTVYGHYDVQPPDPLEEWLSPPFEPVVRDGFVHGRGADDNKGQHLASVLAAEHWFAAGGPPLNLRFLIEGEEEAGGRSLPEHVRANASRLATDFLLIADGSFAAPGLPAIVTGLRGMLYTEIEVVGPRVDLHSGIYGGIAPNPFNSLAHILAGLKDRDGVVQIPRFYDDVVPPSAEELAGWRGLPITEAGELEAIGSSRLTGEPGYSLLERRWARPTLDVHGVIGGFTGAGSKTVIPARAKAKVSMRLVPQQDPATVLSDLREAVSALATPGTHAEVVDLGSAPPVRMETGHPGVAALRRAFAAAFGAEPVLIREGGSVPVTVDFQEALGTHLLVTGFGLPGDALHSPNERMSLDQYHRATEAVIHLMHGLAGGE